MPKTNYRPYSASNALYEIMKKAADSGQEIEIKNVNDRNGNPSAKTSMSALINRINMLSFPGLVFYTRTNYDRIMVIGIRK